MRYLGLFLMVAFFLNKFPVTLAQERSQIAKQQVPGKFESNLPLNLVYTVNDNSRPLAFFISGDGGWSGFDEGVAEQLSETGIPVVGLDSKKYFWKARTPDETTGEITKALRYYLSFWNKKSFILCGYSFGADIVPYIVNRLPADLAPLLISTLMLSPDPFADFEIHVADLLHLKSNKENYNVPSELKKMVTKHVTCIFGEDEKDKDSQSLFEESGAEIKLLPGEHHYNKNYEAIAGEILNSLN